ncbi:hypothetical protein LG302_00195 [Halomonas organivorans]
MMLETAPRQTSRWTRFTDRCYRASLRQQLQEVRYGSPGVLATLVEDLARPLDPALERELARMLDEPGHRDIAPARTLLPVMRQRYGLDPRVARIPEGRTMKATCNGCPAAGRCWRALRHGASAVQCREFCPNAPALAREADSPR